MDWHRTLRCWSPVGVEAGALFLTPRVLSAPPPRGVFSAGDPRTTIPATPSSGDAGYTSLRLNPFLKRKGAVLCYAICIVNNSLFFLPFMLSGDLCLKNICLCQATTGHWRHRMRLQSILNYFGTSVFLLLFPLRVPKHFLGYHWTNDSVDRQMERHYGW